MNEELAAAEAAKRFSVQFSALLKGLELLGNLGSVKQAIVDHTARLERLKADHASVLSARDALRKKTEDELTKLRARSTVEINEKHKAADELVTKAAKDAEGAVAKAMAKESGTIKALEDRKTVLTENVDKLRALHENLTKSIDEQTKKLLELNTNISTSQVLHDDIKDKLSKLKQSL
jgi:chromosome segregation ATPase